MQHFLYSTSSSYWNTKFEQPIWTFIYCCTKRLCLHVLVQFKEKNSFRLKFQKVASSSPSISLYATIGSFLFTNCLFIYNNSAGEGLHLDQLQSYVKLTASIVVMACKGISQNNITTFVRSQRKCFLGFKIKDRGRVTALDVIHQHQSSRKLHSCIPSCG
jgi:hypothetical protein